MPQDYSDDSQLNQQYVPADHDVPFLGINFVQQVDELVSLANYGPSIVLIIGEDGIGKTLIAEQLENETSELGQIRIDGNPMLGIDQLHASFLQQLNDYEQAVEFNSVRDSLQRAAEMKQQLIIVDDAQQLSASVLETLISLASPIEQSPSLPVRLFLFGNKDLKKQLNKDSFPASAIYNLNLKGFEKGEIAQFVGYRLNLSDENVEESFGKQAISRIWKLSYGNPARIIQNMEQREPGEEDFEADSETRWPSIIFRSLLGFLGIALLVMAIWGGGWLKSEQPQKPARIEVEIPQENTENIKLSKLNSANDKVAEIKVTPTIEVGFTEEPKLAVVELGETKILSSEPIAEIAEKLHNQDAVEDGKAKVLEVTEKTKEITQEATKKEIAEALEPAKETIASVKALVVEEEILPTKAELVDEEKSLKPISETKPASISEKIVEQTVKEPTKKASGIVIPQKILEPKAIFYTNDEQFLLNQPMKNYVIQLVGLSSQKDIEKFAKQLQPLQSVYIYRSLLNGKPWFILVTGNYADAGTARAAKENLQASMKAMQPFIKSIAAVQKQIQQAGKSRQ